MQKLQRIKQRWVNDMIKNPDMWEDDERQAIDSMRKGGFQGGGQNRRGIVQRDDGINPNQLRSYFEKRFEDKIETDDILLESDELDLYDEEILYDDPKDLMAIFEDLQE